MGRFKRVGRAKKRYTKRKISFKKIKFKFKKFNFGRRKSWGRRKKTTSRRKSWGRRKTSSRRKTSGRKKFSAWGRRRRTRTGAHKKRNPKRPFHRPPSRGKKCCAGRAGRPVLLSRCTGGRKSVSLSRCKGLRKLESKRFGMSFKRSAKRRIRGKPYRRPFGFKSRRMKYKPSMKGRRTGGPLKRRPYRPKRKAGGFFKFRKSTGGRRRRMFSRTTGKFKKRGSRASTRRKMGLRKKGRFMGVRGSWPKRTKTGKLACLTPVGQRAKCSRRSSKCTSCRWKEENELGEEKALDACMTVHGEVAKC